MIPSHGRYPYSPISERPAYDWPGGKRLAVYIALNLEWFSFGEGLGAELAPPGGPQPTCSITLGATTATASACSAWRSLFAELKLPVSLLVNSAMIEQAPQAIAAFPNAEIVGHGRSNSERQGTLSEADERALIVESTSAIEKHSGTRPRGWLGPWISQSHVTPDLLQEAGYSYLLDWCHDDQPVWMKTRAGRILSLPYPQELNDIPQIVARKREGADFADMIVDAFDVMHAECARRPLVMGIALHPYIVGQPHRFKHLARALKHIVPPTTKSGSPPPAPSPRTRRHCRRAPCPRLRHSSVMVLCATQGRDRGGTDDTTCRDYVGRTGARCLALGNPATAQVTPEQQSAIRGACRGDFTAKCSSVTPGGPEALPVCRKNVAGLSPACKTAVSATLPAATRLPPPNRRRPNQRRPCRRCYSLRPPLPRNRPQPNPCRRLPPRRRPAPLSNR